MVAFGAVVFDFDGTLVDSASLKRAGYRAGMAAVGIPETPEIWAAYDRHRFSNRRVLLAACFTDVCGTEPTAEQAQLLVAGYTDHVLAHPEQVHVLPGIERFACRSGGMPLYVSSNAPGEEVLATCQGLGIIAYFRQVFGFPLSKVTAISQVANSNGIAVGEVLYVGDHPGDEELAASVGAQFVHLDPTGEFRDEVSSRSTRSLDELGDLLFGVTA